MAIDFESFVGWCEEKFDKVVVKGQEIRINSIFIEDDESQHLWCSPKGGKHRRQDGCYRCFKTDKKGTLIGLVMLVDNCSYDEAKEILSGRTLIGDLEQKLDEFFKEKENIVEPEVTNLNKMKLPIGSFMIDFLPEGNATRINAERYLKSRKIPTSGLYICTEGNYKNRIIIPYYDSKGKLIYFNGRNLADKGLRYLGPDKEIGVGKGDVIFALKWPIKDSKIHLTEGEFDAMSLCSCGYNGMACGGKYLSDNQIQLLRNYKVCLALDEDISGLMGIKTMADRLIACQVSEITYVRPPQGMKDWNKMLVMFKPEIVKAYIDSNEKKFDDFTNIFL